MLAKSTYDLVQDRARKRINKNNKLSVLERDTQIRKEKNVAYKDYNRKIEASNKYRRDHEKRLNDQLKVKQKQLKELQVQEQKDKGPSSDSSRFRFPSIYSKQPKVDGKHHNGKNGKEADKDKDSGSLISRTEMNFIAIDTKILASRAEQNRYIRLY